VGTQVIRWTGACIVSCVAQHSWPNMTLHKVWLCCYACREAGIGKPKSTASSAKDTASTPQGAPAPPSGPQNVLEERPWPDIPVSSWSCAVCHLQCHLSPYAMLGMEICASTGADHGQVMEFSFLKPSQQSVVLTAVLQDCVLTDPGSCRSLPFPSWAQPLKQLRASYQV
jgi:hypothetical protein